MTERTIELDQHRGMAAQKATEIRRLVAEVEADERALRLRQNELEAQLVAVPATTWHDAAEKARYLLSLFASTPVAQDPRRQQTSIRGRRQKSHLVGLGYQHGAEFSESKPLI
jgi:hypothetical protein